MIKLVRGVKPKYLTDKKVKELTEDFKKDRTKTVWKSNKIGTNLLKSSFYKCAYCECKLQREDSYMQVEHFKDKDTFPDDVVNWDNLLPSCGRCNRKKWTLDVTITPIINPYDDNPKQHLKLQAFRLYAKDNKGDSTIKKLFLNDDERVVLPRFLAANEISRQLHELSSDLSDLDKIRNGITTLLQSCQADQPYSAFLSHTLHSDRDYKDLKTLLERKSLWDADLNDLHQNSSDLALESR